MIEVTTAGVLDDVKILVPKRFHDARGFFSETYNRRTLASHGIAVEFVQDNHSLSSTRGTLRGLHFQSHPFAQAKLVRVVRGSIRDVAVDIRHGSPTFGRHASAVLSAKAGNQIFIPVGFAHGFVTLEADTEVVYKVSEFFSLEHDCGLLWNDPALAIDWGMGESELAISDKDRRHPRLKDLPRYFEFEIPPRPNRLR